MVTIYSLDTPFPIWNQSVVPIQNGLNGKFYYIFLIRINRRYINLIPSAYNHADFPYFNEHYLMNTASLIVNSERLKSLPDQK